ncbi:MAG: hypothetical protein J3K34DRAFT_422420 [Monoraphidium minutum]|nr:MAG: hypothetical protein J3K34DRAFT_422420 [Monoraphidium minutum]
MHCRRSSSGVAPLFSCLPFAVVSRVTPPFLLVLLLPSCVGAPVVGSSRRRCGGALLLAHATPIQINAHRARAATAVAKYACSHV